MSRRWSIRALSQLERGSPETAHVILQNVTHRLHDQFLACQELQSSGILQEQQQKRASSAQSHLAHLTHVHYDTWLQCQRILDNGSLLQRWSKADQHYIHALLTQTRDRHAPGLERWVEIVTDLNRLNDANNDNNASANNSGDDLLTADEIIHPILQRRIGIQLLTDHYDKLCKGAPQGEGQVGAVQVHQPLWSLTKRAYEEAQHIGEVHLLSTPDLVMMEGQETATATTVHSWIHHVLVEIFKNSLQATVEHAQQINPTAALPLESSLLPPIQVHIDHDNNNNNSSFTMIHVKDQGPGIPNHAMERVFQLGQSSAQQRWDRLEEQQSYAAVRSPLRSMGVGLTLSRLFLRHFGGELTLTNNNSDNSNNQHGCEACLSLPLDDTILEPEIQPLNLSNNKQTDDNDNDNEEQLPSMSI